MRLHTYLLACAMAGLAGCASSPKPAAESHGPALSAEVSYRALWWATSQMEGLNPNHPPPKTTEVKLDKWEYSDPIGVPHPDTVDVTVVVENRSDQPASNVVVEVGARWQVGPQKDQSKAAWQTDAFAPIHHSEPLSIPAHGHQVVKVPVDLAAKMKSLEAAENWPWTLQTEATVSAAGGTPVKVRASLPITPGD